MGGFEDERKLQMGNSRERWRLLWKFHPTGALGPGDPNTTLTPSLFLRHQQCSKGSIMTFNLAKIIYILLEYVHSHTHIHTHTYTDAAEVAHNLNWGCNDIDISTCCW